MILFKDFKSHVHSLLEGTNTNNNKNALDEIVLLAIYHFNNDEKGFQHPKENSLLFTDEERLLLFSTVRKCLRDPCETKLKVSCYILNALTLVVTDEEHSVNILKLIYHLISIASSSSFQSSLEITIQGFMTLNVIFAKINTKQQQHDSKRSTIATAHRRRRRKNNTTKENCESIDSEKENISSKVELLPVPYRPFHLNNNMNFRQLCKLIVGCIVNVSQVLLLSSDHATAFHILSNNALPWIRLLLQEKEDEKAMSDAVHYAQSCYRMVWDYSQTKRSKTNDILRFQSFAIQCLFLKINQTVEENENQQLSTIILPEKVLDYACTDVYNSINHNSYTQEALISFHETVGNLLDQQVSLLPSATIPTSYCEYCYIRAVHLSQQQQNVEVIQRNPLTIFPFAESKHDNESLQTIVLAIIYIYLSRLQLQQQQQHCLVPMLQTYWEKFHSFLSKSKYDSKILYKCWKLLHQLNIISSVSSKISLFNEASSNQKNDPQDDNILVIEAHILSKCIAPLSLLLDEAIANQDSAHLVDNKHNIHTLVNAISEKEETTMKFMSMIFQEEIQETSTVHNMNILNTAVDAWMKAAMIYDHLQQYSTANFCFIKAASACCCYNQINLLQLVSKGIATIGRKRLMTNHAEAAILPLLLSCHFFSSPLLKNDEKQDLKNLALRYSSLASSLALCYREEATIAYAISIRYHLLSNELTTANIPDLSTDFALLSSNTLFPENDASVATLDKLHRHVFRKNENVNNITSKDVFEQNALTWSEIGSFLVENRKLNNFVSILLTVLTTAKDRSNINVPSFYILQVLRVCISFLGKEYQRQMRMATGSKTESGGIYTFKTADVCNEFRGAIHLSISYVDNFSANQNQLLEKASIYLIAAKSLLPQGMQEFNNTGTRSDSIPSNVKELVREAFGTTKAAFEILLKIDDVNTAQYQTNQDAKRSMIILTFSAYTSIILVEMSQAIDEPLPPEFCASSNDPDSPFIYILNMCARAVILAIGKTSAVDDVAAIQSLYTTLCQLHTRFYHSGSMVHAARAAYHAAMLDSRSIALSSTYSSSALALVGSDVLLEGELYDSSYKCLLASEHMSVEQKKLPTCISSLEDCIQLDRAALMAALEVQCGHPCSEEHLNTINFILLTTRQYFSNSNSATSISEHDDVAFLVNWIRTACLFSIANANVNNGRLVDALSALKECSVVCKENIKFCRRPSVQQKALANQSQIFIVTRWIGRLSSCLMSMSICFSKLGDRRRAEGYSVASLEILGLNFNDDEKQEVDWLSCRAVGATRECWQIKVLSMSSKIFEDGLEDHLFQYVEKGATTDNVYASISGMHWKVEFIRFLIYRGDKLKRLSCRDANNGFSECYYTAFKLLAPLLSAQYGPLIDEAIGFTVCKHITKDKHSLDVDSRFDCRLSALESSLKLRLARCIELAGNTESTENGDAARLYEEVRQSPYSNGIDRARSCYRLGRIFLDKARKAGELSYLWKGHLEFTEPTEDGNKFVKNTKQGATSADFDRKGSEDYLSHAANLFREAFSCTGETSEKLTRHILRSLALAIGPSKSIRKHLHYSCISEAALLIHLSTGMSSRQLVSRVYADGAQVLDEKDKKVKEAFEACSTEILKSDEALRKFFHSVSIVPHDWIITALTLAPSGEMLISAIRSDVDGRINANAMCIFPSENDASNLYFRNTLDEMDRILEINRTQLSGMDPSSAKNFGKEETQKWWQDRKLVDQELKYLIESFEKRCFRSRPIANMFCHHPANQVLLQAPYDDNKVELGKDTEQRGQMRSLETVFDQQCNINNEEEEAHSVLSLRQDLQKLNVAQLKDRLEMGFGVEKKVTRRLKKAEIIDLILSEQQRQKHTISQISSCCTNSSDTTTLCPRGTNCSASDVSPLPPSSCTILVLDERLHRFPWENLSLFSGTQVCRVPSLPFVIAPLIESEQPAVEPCRTTYLIDPESNLSSTRHKLEEAIGIICGKQVPSWKWNGIVGQIPPLSFFKEAMEQKSSLFLYCGHGGGESCFSRARVEEMLFYRKDPPCDNSSGRKSNISYRQCKSSIILMGCSSGSLSLGGGQGMAKQASSDYFFYEPEGIATWYLMAGAPCVVGNLWDVTDRDIDRYCIELIETFFGNEPPGKPGCSLAQCVAIARDACKMRYIVGCAPVCYGVPVYLTRKSS